MAIGGMGWLLCSCQSLETDGKAPPTRENLVPPAGPVEHYPPAGALNYMSTSLTAAGMNYFRPGEIVSCRYDFASSRPEFNSFPLKVLHNVRDLMMFRPATVGRITLFSRIEKMSTPSLYHWEMRLECEGRTLWQDRVVIEYQAPGVLPAATPAVSVTAPAGSQSVPVEPTIVAPRLVQEPTMIPPRQAYILDKVENLK